VKGKLERRCVSCQKIAPRDEFWRIVRLPNHAQQDHVQLERGMGRSAYICRTLECLQQAQKKNRLGRSLRTNIAPEIFAQLQARLIDPTR
jgi:uncharacterized protein